ncbi:MAG: hypothetical protein M1827_002166 [Pycnora praestabilis]|nr:MAG: hypothetical protein M1827_002166 [Pycnora praestabilis]
MSFLRAAALLGALSSVARVAAHGVVTGIILNGRYVEGYQPSFQHQNPPSTVVGWSIPEDGNLGFVSPANYTSPDIICHVAATPAGTHATVAAGSTVELQWTIWPSSHHGPVIDYLANCNGECETVDKTTLGFFKIDGVGLIDDSTLPGTWASDQLIANNNSWTVTIPSTIAPGNYVLRHEIIALHSAEDANGAQNYPQCINLQVTGNGTDDPAGTLGEALYSSTDPGILVNIYQTLSSYIVPGPALYSGAVNSTQTISASVTASASIASSPAANSTASVSRVSTSSAINATAASTSAYTNYTTSPSLSSSSDAAPMSASKTKCVNATTSTTTSQVYVTAISTAYSSFSAVKKAAVPTTTSGLPSSMLPSLSPSALPTGLPGNITGIYITNSTSPSPNVTVPPGMSLRDLLEWLEYLVGQILKDTSDHRDHAKSINMTAPISRSEQIKRDLADFE